LALTYHPDPATIVICDFRGYIEPEMIKRRPAIVLSPRMRTREGVCTIVPLSTSRPKTVCAHHCQLIFDPPLPEPYDAGKMWVKADMVCAVAFARLDLPLAGREPGGKRIYDIRHISADDFTLVKECVLNGIGLGHLTQHL
jgi:mRNA interferase MazF